MLHKVLEACLTISIGWCCNCTSSGFFSCYSSSLLLLCLLLSSQFDTWTSFALNALAYSCSCYEFWAVKCRFCLIFGRRCKNLRFADPKILFQVAILPFGFSCTIEVHVAFVCVGHQSLLVAVGAIFCCLWMFLLWATIFATSASVDCLYLHSITMACFPASWSGYPLLSVASCLFVVLHSFLLGVPAWWVCSWNCCIVVVEALKYRGCTSTFRP